MWRRERYPAISISFEAIAADSVNRHEKARHQIGDGLLISVRFGGAVFPSSVRLAADEGDGADVSTDGAGVLLSCGTSGGTGGGTAGFLMLDPLLVADDAEGGEDDDGEDQAADEGGTERDGIAFEGTAGADGEECVGGGDDCGDGLLHCGLRFRGAVHLMS